MLIKFHASGGIQMLNKTLKTITFQQRKHDITQVIYVVFKDHRIKNKH